MRHLDKIFPFLNFLHKLRAIERKQYVVYGDRKENDVEHSYQLAMLCWFLVDHLKLDLDMNLVFKYALAHDLVEVYAGDTPFWDAQKSEDDKKDEKEKQALKKIQETFKDSFPELGEIITEYEEEKTNSREARFVYALDKLIPTINNYQDNGRSWKEFNPELKLEKVIKLKREKIKHSPEVEEIFDELIVLLKERKDELFANG